MWLAFVPAGVFANALAPTTLPEGAPPDAVVDFPEIDSTKAKNTVPPEEEPVTEESKELTEEKTPQGDVHFEANEYVHITEEQQSDVYIASNTLVVSSEINGDLFAAGNDITIEHDVHGSVRLAGNTVTIHGTVDENALIFANTVIISEEATIEGNANIYASTVRIDGSIHNNLTIDAQSTELNGRLENAVNIHGERVYVEKNTKFNTPSNIAAEKLYIDNTADGTQYITYTKEKDAGDIDQKMSEHRREFHAFIRSYFFFLALGIIFILLWPSWTARVVDSMNIRTKESWLKGAIFFFATPAVLLLLMCTMIGIPLALVGSIGYMVLLALGQMMVGLWFGYHLVNRERLKNSKFEQILCFTIGYFIITVLMQLPVFGMVFTILAAMWGAGAIIVAHAHRVSVAPKAKSVTTAKPKKRAPRRRKSTSSK